MSFANRVTDFSFNDQLADFEQVLTTDEAEEYDANPSRGCSYFRTFSYGDEDDPFESQHLIGGHSDDDWAYGYGGSYSILKGGNPASGTFLISLSNLATLICATILLHSCVRSWSDPSHYVLCIVGLFVSTVVICNTAMALIAVCMFQKCRKRHEQGMNLLKMHHSLSLMCVLILVIFCASLERFWGTKAEEASESLYLHLKAYVNRNWMAFLCMLTICSLTLGVVGNLRWPNWNENHVSVLKWTLFSSSLISLGIGLCMSTVGTFLLFWVHDSVLGQVWGIFFGMGSAVLLSVLAIGGMSTRISATRVKYYMLLAPVTCLAVAVPATNNLSSTYPYATGAVDTQAYWLKEACVNSYCPDLVFALGSAGFGSIFFIVIGLISATMVRPYYVLSHNKK